jgi:hypothetical protein
MPSTPHRHPYPLARGCCQRKLVLISPLPHSIAPASAAPATDTVVTVNCHHPSSSSSTKLVESTPYTSSTFPTAPNPSRRPHRRREQVSSAIVFLRMPHCHWRPFNSLRPSQHRRKLQRSPQVLHRRTSPLETSCSLLSPEFPLRRHGPSLSMSLSQCYAPNWVPHQPNRMCSPPLFFPSPSPPAGQNRLAKAEGEI